MGKIPARVHYGPASDPKERCGTCQFNQAGYCRMWKTRIDLGYSCDEWAGKPVAAATLNTHFARVRDHVADHHEERLARSLAVILRDAGREAARRFETHATEHLIAASRPPTQAMVALYPRPEEAASIVHPDGHPPGEMHVTLVYFDHGDVAADPGSLEEAVRAVAAASEPLEGTVGGVGAFAPSDSSSGRAPSIMLPNVPGLVELRQAVLAAVEQAGYRNASAHGFNPHITQRYTDGPEPPDAGVLGVPLHFDGLSLTLSDGVPRAFPLGGPGALTAAGDWTPPDPAEMLDVERLILAMRGRIDPVRLAVAEQLMTDPVRRLSLTAFVEKAKEGIRALEAEDRRNLKVQGVKQIDALKEAGLLKNVEAIEVIGSMNMAAEEIGAPNDIDLLIKVLGGTPEQVKYMNDYFWQAKHELADVHVIFADMSAKGAVDGQGLFDAAGAAKLRDKTVNVYGSVATVATRGTGVGILEGVGLSFDVTNPFVEAVVSSQMVTNIGDTTRADLMRIIRTAYREGLTIPDTAKAIRAGMTEASVTRSRLIARTEMVGLVNGGSLATMKIVDAALGPEGGYRKQWMTAPGAEYPRHEEYDGLDGQTVDLDEAFDVGGSALEFPGDPGGPPEEVCNCRCTMQYSDGTPA